MRYNRKGAATIALHDDVNFQSIAYLCDAPCFKAFSRAKSMCIFAMPALAEVHCIQDERGRLKHPSYVSIEN